MRKTVTYTGTIHHPNLSEFQGEQILFLNSNTVNGKQLLAVGVAKSIRCVEASDALKQLEEVRLRDSDWWFGYLSYGLRNAIENLSAEEQDAVGFPLFHLWQPKLVFEWRSGENTTQVHALQEVENSFIDAVWDKLNTPSVSAHESFGVELTPRFSKEVYQSKFERLQNEIKLGNVYELNFCQEFYSEKAQVSPSRLHHRLNEITSAPYSAYMQDGERYAICASPERYIKKVGSTLFTSPIKGTIARHRNAAEDEAHKQRLLNNLKETTENVMIVDLVRNDVSKIAERGSVKVEELNKLYSFKTVHQLISTISCQLKNTVDFKEILEATFPMGSMTGAPKIAAMQLAQQYEEVPRGLYSGTIGYISPNGDFEFNVVIRSLLYNTEKQYLSCFVGSAITAMANAEDEYEECLLKAKAMQQAVQ